MWIAGSWAFSSIASSLVTIMGYDYFGWIVVGVMGLITWIASVRPGRKQLRHNLWSIIGLLLSLFTFTMLEVIS